MDSNGLFDLQASRCAMLVEVELRAMLAMMTIMTRCFLIYGVSCGLGWVLMGWGTGVVGQDPKAPSVDSKVKVSEVVLAKLGKQEILWSELAYRWRLGGVKIVELNQVDPLALVEGVEAARKQRIAQAELDRNGLGASAKEVDQWIELRLEGIEGDKLTAADLADKEGLTLASWQTELRWQKSWEEYTRQLITDEKLKRHYEMHQEWFDGTEREVFHVIRSLKWNDRSGREKAVSEFSKLVQQIRAKQLTFEDAAKKWSSGATAEQGGRLGWMTYQGPMHPSFNRVVFGLGGGELSEPVETPHGVHLIWVRSVKHGALPFDRVIENVRRSMLLIEFEKLVSAYPKAPQIEWVYDIDGQNK
jgi:peptidyl-prolyl cis-trans isomerase C